MGKTARSRILVFSALCIALLLCGDAGRALDAESIPFPEICPENTRQRGLNEIQELPEKEIPCPVCDFRVKVPLADKLMLTPSSSDGKRKWQMDAAKRDSDFCPYPVEGKVHWQADVALCPSCGYASAADAFADAVSPEAKEWILENLRPNLHESFSRLLGWRRGEMTDDQVAVFFNHQGEIPDPIRLEHWSICLDGMHAPALTRARAQWLTAWAFRRKLLENPKSEIFVRHTVELQNELAVRKHSLTGIHADVDALRSLLRRKRQGQSGLPGAVDMTGRLLLAGLWTKHGFLAEAETILSRLYEECRERFLRPEQDPLWTETSTRASQAHRLNELELMRADAEREVLMHVELVRGEKARLLSAAALIRQAMGEGALDGKPRAALFYSYLIGEFLRRGGNLPLAAEWLKQLASIAGAETKLGVLAAEQLDCIDEEAGGKVNLLSALGQDGELFARLREIMRLPMPANGDDEGF